VFASYVLLTVAWIVGNPPYAGPDEWHHYARAVGMGHGQLMGEPAGLEGARAIVGAERPPYLSEHTYRNQLRWVAQNTTRVQLPAGMMPGWFRCGALQRDPHVSARCLNDSPPLPDAQTVLTPSGTYQPFPYLVPAALSRVVVDPDTVTRVMRSGKALIALLLVGAAILSLWDSRTGAVSLVGVAAAVTPMAVFLSSTLNPSGLEIPAALGFAAAALRLTRGNGDRRWNWTVLAICGGVLALSRSQGPLWIALDTAIVVSFSGVRGAWTIAVADRKWSTLALLVIGAAVVLNRLWEQLYGPILLVDPFPVRESLRAGIGQLREALRQQIGVFDYLEVDMPRLAYAIWVGLTCAIVGAGFAIGTRRQRFLLVVAIFAVLAVPIALVATTMRHTGFALQGRYVLAFSLLVPLLAGEILVRQHERLPSLARRLLCLSFVAVAFVQAVAWWANARRFAVGRDGPRWFLNVAEWNPPFGWWPWAILAAAGAGLLLLTALLEQIRKPEFLNQRHVQ
jgi:hypothetical protein